MARASGVIIIPPPEENELDEATPDTSNEDELDEIELLGLELNEEEELELGDEIELEEDTELDDELVLNDELNDTLELGDGIELEEGTELDDKLNDTWGLRDELELDELRIMLSLSIWSSCIQAGCHPSGPSRVAYQ